jgi:hypothetical protein
MIQPLPAQVVAILLEYKGPEDEIWSFRQGWDL